MVWLNLCAAMLLDTGCAQLLYGAVLVVNTSLKMGLYNHLYKATWLVAELSALESHTDLSASWIHNPMILTFVGSQR